MNPRNTFATLLLLLFATYGYSQSTFDFELSIDLDGNYAINNEAAKRSKIKKIIKGHLEKYNELSLGLSVAENIEYDKIERLRNSYEKYVTEEDEYTMTFLNPEQPATKEGKYVISGKVVDHRNEPLKHINVILKGTRTGQVSADDGSFSLKVPKDAKSLVLVGEFYKEVEIDIETLDVLNNSDLVVRLSRK